MPSGDETIQCQGADALEGKWADAHAVFDNDFTAGIGKIDRAAGELHRIDGYIARDAYGAGLLRQFTQRATR
ncbi:MAG: hypothetical protein AAYR33_06035 [Acetobacteraceae bacterium]